VRRPGRSSPTARSDRESGAAAVEFALIALVLIPLLFGIMEFGRFVTVQSGVETATREAARYGSAVGDSGNGVPRYADCSEIKQAGASRSGLANLEADDLAVTFDNGPGTAVIATCPASGNIDPGLIAAGDRIVVTATLTYDSFAYFFGSREVTATDRRTIFKP
jgi:Flp pilus assembly protein TadG